MLKGILFDFDGTLADSMDYHFLAWKKTFSEINIHIKKKDYFPLEGMDLKKIAIFFHKDLNISDNQVNKLVERKKIYYRIYKKKIKLYPKVKIIINKLIRLNIKIGIVTSSHSDSFYPLLSKKFISKFDCIVTGDKVKKNKPNPEPYINGLKLLNLKPSECVAIENSPLGIISATSAKLYCIAITSTMGKKYLKNANEILNNITKIMNNKKLI